MKVSFRDIIRLGTQNQFAILFLLNSGIVKMTRPFLSKLQSNLLSVLRKTVVLRALDHFLTVDMNHSSLAILLQTHAATQRMVKSNYRSLPL